MSPARAIPGRRRIRGWKGWSLLAIVLAVALAFPILSSPDVRADCPATLRIDEPGDPPISGERVSLSEAEGILRHEILRPQDPLASDETLTAVWASEPNRQVGLAYESGVMVMLDPLRQPEDHPERPYGVRPRHGRRNYTTTIEGVPALVNPGDLPCRGPGAVMMIVDAHVLVMAVDTQIPEKELLRIAVSVFRSRVGADENSVTATQR